MSRITELLRRVEQDNPDLARDLLEEYQSLSDRRAFGLNFERHVPETVELPHRKVRRGDKVRFLAERGEAEKGLDRRLWLVTRVSGKGADRSADIIEWDKADSPETTTRVVEDLVVVAEFRDPIYPGLRSTGSVERGDDQPFHAVINGENFHALEALLFAYEGKVDCIYIDPPYNTRDRDWKYNNDYVDSDDAYKHSKWLAMMERRLRLARKLLNPDASVLIVTIDEKEVHRLGLLLEQTFPESQIQMVNTLINPKGTGRIEGFRRVDEYILVMRFGDQQVTSSVLTPLGSKSIDAVIKEKEAGDTEPIRIPIDWQTCRRRDLASVRPTRPAQFYPIYVNIESGFIEAVGEPLPHDVDRGTAPTRAGCVAVFPVRDDGTEMNWGVTGPTFVKRWKQGYARAGKAQPGKPQEYIIQYLKSGPIKDIENGRAKVDGHNPDGSVLAYYEEEGAKTPPTQWHLRSHNAEHYGTKVLRALLPGRDFPFPKSLYAVEDSLRLFVGTKPDAVILDFFAGSGTTAHAVARLNKQDGGHRQSIIVTNNEVSASEADDLWAKGLRPGDGEWESLGICEYITKPRIRAAVTGETPQGKPIDGEYRFTDEFPMSEGFKENVEFFELTYEDPERVRLNMAFAAIAPLLWMKAGSRGRRIDEPSETFDITDVYGVLFSVDAAADFLQEAKKKPDLTVAYVVTDDERQYQMVAGQLPAHVEVVQLYDSYLTSFELNSGWS